MKILKLQFKLSLVILATFLISFSIITGIIKAGMGFGIFIIVAVFTGIIVLIVRSGKNKQTV